MSTSFGGSHLRDGDSPALANTIDVSLNARKPTAPE
jgi:hypothetical protein